MGTRAVSAMVVIVGIAAMASFAVCGGSIDMTVGVSKGVMWPWPPYYDVADRMGIGLLCSEGQENMEIRVFPIVDGGIGDPTCIGVRSRWIVRTLLEDGYGFPGTDAYLEPSVLFFEMRKAALGLGLGWQSPQKGTVVLSSAINSQVELTLSPSFRVGRVALTLGLEAEARLPLTSAMNGSQIVEDAVLAGEAALFMLAMDGLALFALTAVLLPLLLS